MREYLICHVCVCVCVRVRVVVGIKQNYLLHASQIGVEAWKEIASTEN